MWVRALSSATGRGDCMVVRTTRGDACGIWMGRTPVGVGAAFDVELEVPGRRPSVDLRPDRGEPGLAHDGNGMTTLCAAVCALDENDVLTLSTGNGLVMIEIDGDLPLGIVGSGICLSVPDLEFHPTGI